MGLSAPTRSPRCLEVSRRGARYDRTLTWGEVRRSHLVDQRDRVRPLVLRTRSRCQGFTQVGVEESSGETTGSAPHGDSALAAMGQRCGSPGNSPASPALMKGVGGLVFVIARSMVAAHGNVSVSIVAGNAHASAGLPEVSPSNCSGLCRAGRAGGPFTSRARDPPAHAHGSRGAAKRAP